MTFRSISDIINTEVRIDHESKHVSILKERVVSKGSFFLDEKILEKPFTESEMYGLIEPSK